MDLLHVVALRGICASHFDTVVAPVLHDLRQAQETLLTRVEGLVSQLAGKADETMVRDLVADLHGKADFDAISTAMQKEMAALDMGGLQARIEGFEAALTKTEAEDVATAEQLKMLTSQVQKLSSSVDKKVGSGTVPTMTEFKSLVTLVETKANARNVPTAAAHRELAEAVERKADMSRIPSLAQLNKLCGAVERKLDSRLQEVDARHTELAAVVNLKADRDKVPSLERFDLLSSAVTERASCDEVAAASAKVESLSQEMEWKADIRQPFSFVGAAPMMCPAWDWEGPAPQMMPIGYAEPPVTQFAAGTWDHGHHAGAGNSRPRNNRRMAGHGFYPGESRQARGCRSGGSGNSRGSSSVDSGATTGGTSPTSEMAPPDPFQGQPDKMPVSGTRPDSIASPLHSSERCSSQQQQELDRTVAQLLGYLQPEAEEQQHKCLEQRQMQSMDKEDPMSATPETFICTDDEAEDLPYVRRPVSLWTEP